MNNEQYLTVSYFTLGAAALGVGAATWWWLRRSFRGLTGAIGPHPVAEILRRLFCPGLLLPAMAGFLAVSFRSCDKETYAKIVADRTYLAAKNHELVASTLTWTAVALVAWGALVLGVWLAARPKRPGRTGP